MKKIPKFFWVLLAITVFWTWRHFDYPSGSWNYRMTVAVNTPEGIVTGSAVRRISFRNERSVLPDQGGTFYSIAGEAVVVDLKQRGMLFALMRNYDVDYAHYVALDSFPLKENTAPGTKVTLDLLHYPMFVAFRDSADPRTIEEVLETGPETPGKAHSPLKIIADHFAEIYGAGVSLKDVTIEVTQDDVTWGIEEKLPWLKNVQNYIAGKHRISETGLYAELALRDFKRGHEHAK